MPASSDVTTVVAVNNAISADLTRRDLAARGIRLDSTVLILLRDISEPWMQECGVVLEYPGRPSSSLVGQRRFARFYWNAARLLSRLEAAGTLSHVYVVNNDNLLTSHLFSMAMNNPAIEVNVVVEGIMNFQKITTASRARWRWLVKPVIARLIGLRYRTPGGHLSGAFESRTNRVISFALDGLQAPQHKVVIRPYRAVRPSRRTDPEVALVVLSGLNQWMEADAFEFFAREFVRWIESRGFREIQVKEHPRISSGLLDQLLGGYRRVGVGMTTEDMAADLEAGTVIGSCCTALVTLKLMRPDIECIDFGSDYYSEEAYGGDRTVQRLLSSAGVCLEQIVEDPQRRGRPPRYQARAETP